MWFTFFSDLAIHTIQEENMDLDPEKQVPSKLAPTSELLTQQSTNGWGLVGYLWMNRWMNPKHPKKNSHL